MVFHSIQEWRLTQFNANYIFILRSLNELVLLLCDNWISETIHVETIGKRTITEKKAFVTQKLK